MQQNHRELERWLKAEAEGRRVDADRACRRTFLQMPPVPLPAGMTERIVTAVVAAIPRRRDPFLRPVVRLSIAASFLITALVAAWLPRALAGAGGHLRIGHFIDFLQSATSTISTLVASTAGLWDQWIDLAQLGAGAAGSPVFLLCFSALAGFALVTFRLLSDWTLRQKGLSHVDAI